ncbi:hypothetical protein PCANC_21159 [Puccinia coronata f. sp. avenae]|uniref:Uncharacterized protein n=1 Tax=Puccinia coronata f. sp. avenae TaxID=200324 RepID=A0A2N5ST37_9BASI|nr:hypothetical protein PCANC_21159 [Puccinia coronata f. sp. avenae]
MATGPFSVLSSGHNGPKAASKASSRAPEDQCVLTTLQKVSSQRFLLKSVRRTGAISRKPPRGVPHNSPRTTVPLPASAVAAKRSGPGCWNSFLTQAAREHAAFPQSLYALPSANGWSAGWSGFSAYPPPTLVSPPTSYHASKGGPAVSLGPPLADAGEVVRSLCRWFTIMVVSGMLGKPSPIASPPPIKICGRLMVKQPAHHSALDLLKRAFAIALQVRAGQAQPFDLLSFQQLSHPQSWRLNNTSSFLPPPFKNHYLPHFWILVILAHSAQQPAQKESSPPRKNPIHPDRISSTQKESHPPRKNLVMKSSHVALVVSALAMTASGVSIGSLPPSPTKLSRNSREQLPASETQVINRRRPARGPLPRTHKRVRSSKYFPRGEKENVENLPPSLEEYLHSFPHETARSLHSPSSQLHQVNANLVKPNSASEAIPSVSDSTLSSDVPGFVDVALPDQGAGVARTVSGLAYSLNSDPTGELELGTSASHSTQFFMSPIKNRPGSSLFRLRVPVMDSTTFQTVNHCATFPISPAGPLSMKKCGSLPGFSQTFSYDAVSGELLPVYQDGSSSDLAASDQTVSSPQMSKRRFYRDSNCEPGSIPLSKRDGKASTFNPSGIFYFVPAEGAKIQTSPALKLTD